MLDDGCSHPAIPTRLPTRSTSLPSPLVIMVKFASVLAVFTAFICALPARAQEAAAYVIQDSTTGFILDSSNGQKKLPVASLTKIATAMVVLDWAAQTNAELNQLAVVPASAARVAVAQGVGLAPGDRVSLRDLLYAAMMQSDNVSAETLADHVGRALGGGRDGSPVDAFVAQMNALARAKDMLKTKFLNAHGLDNLERSVPTSTAEDMARLTAYAMGNSAFRFYVSQKERKINITTANGEQTGYLLRNTNELLGVNSIDGVKTGTTRRAGECLIISAAKPPESRQEGDKHFITPRRLNVVLLGATNRFPLAQSLLARGWQDYDAWSAAGRPAKGWKPAR
jgi:serine-type D-Ala-D-Ala carboxypeptidase (penicillin-binding protein 5/6)